MRSRAEHGETPNVSDRHDTSRRPTGGSPVPLRFQILLVALLSFLLYANSLVNGFVLDDTFLIVGNPWVGDFTNLPRMISADYWAPTGQVGLYRPLTTVTYSLNHLTGGGEPFAYHLTNVFLHAANSALVLVLVLLATGRARLSFLSALLFAAHPIHTEAVAGISSGRPELLAAAFMLLSLVLYAARYRGRCDPKVCLTVSLIFFALALASKESAFVLPALVPLVGWMERTDDGNRPRPWGRLLTDSAPYLAVALTYLVVRWKVLENSSFLPILNFLDNPLIALEPGWRMVSAIYVGLRYFWLLIFPANLSYDYSFDQIPAVVSPGDPRVLLVALALPVVAALIFVASRRNRTTAFAIAFSLLTFGIVANIVLPIGTVMADRLLYIPSIGFTILVASILLAVDERLPGRLGRPMWLMLCVLLLGGYSIRTLVRNADWRSEETLFIHDVEVSPRSAKARANAGAIRLRNREAEEALAHYLAAIATGITPEQYPLPFLGVVRSLLLLDRVDEARALYERLRPYGFRDPVAEQEIGLP